MAPSPPLVITSQPFRALYVIYSIFFTLLIRFPIYSLLYIPQSLRQHKEWSWNQAIRVRLLRFMLATISTIRIKVPESLIPGKEDGKFVVMEPADAKYFKGVASADKLITPKQVGGTWYPGPGMRKGKDLGRDEFVVLHFHGGAYVVGDGRTDDAGFLSKTLLSTTPAKHVFCPQYRLAQNKLGRFPAMLQDGITSFCHLVIDLGIDPKKIILSGDSAGANLAVQLLRYLGEFGREIGLDGPVAAWLWSPWVHPPHAHYDHPAISTNPNLDIDYIPAGFGDWGARASAPSPTLSSEYAQKADTYINNLDKPFTTPTPLYVSAAEAEFLFFDIVKFYEQMREKNRDGKVTLQVEEHCVHDIVLVGKLVGFETEAEVAGKRAGEWLKGVVGV